MIKEKLHGDLYGTDSKLIEEFRYVGEIRDGLKEKTRGGFGKGS